MKIERVSPPPQPFLFQMTFSQNDGWAVVAALREYADNHEGAVHKEEWRKWAIDLDKELRR